MLAEPLREPENVLAVVPDARCRYNCPAAVDMLKLFVIVRPFAAYKAASSLTTPVPVIVAELTDVAAFSVTAPLAMVRLPVNVLVPDSVSADVVEF